MKFFFGIVLLISFSCNSKKNNVLYEGITYYHHPTSKDLSINEIIEIHQTGNFLKETSPKYYKKLGNNTWWYHFNLEKGKGSKFFKVSSSYLSYGKIFIKRND